MTSLFVVLCMLGSVDVNIIGSNRLEIAIRIDDIGEAPFFIEDGVRLNKAGEPDLPSLLYRIGLPQDGGVDVRIVEKRDKKLRDVEILPVYHAGIREGIPFERAVDTGEVYRQDRFFPSEIVEMSRPGYYRDLYVAALRVNPVQYNPVKREATIITFLRLELTFTGTPRPKTVLDRGFEELYERMILNYAQCRTWRREPQPDIRSGPFEQGVWYKIEVASEGAYKIGYDEIVQAGLNPQQFDPVTLKLYSAPFDLLPGNVTMVFADSMIEIPVYVQGEDDHQFDPGDYLLFYGFAASHFTFTPEVSWYDNGYASRNVYWLTFGGAPGRRMVEVEAAWNGNNPDTTVTEIVHFEEDIGNPTRSGVNWYWLDVSPGTGPLGSGSISLEHPFARGPAEITLGIFTMTGATFLYECAIDGDVFFSETLYVPARTTWPPYYLTGTVSLSTDSSILDIDIIRIAGVSTNLTAYFNSADLRYTRLADLSRPFHAYMDTARAYTLECANAHDDVFILDITDGHTPRRLVNYYDEAGTIRLSSSTDSVQLLYFTTDVHAEAATLIAADPGRARSPSSGCEYLFITHPKFLTALQPLVAYRSQDYITRVVTVDQLYDDFSFGKYDPLAIKHFLYYTTNNWTMIPKFILLVGDATYDYKNNLRKENPPNYVPMYEAGTQLAGNPGMPPNFIDDGYYVNFGGGESMVLGRITVRNTHEVRDFIDKLFMYETQNIDGMWSKNIILAGDDEYSGTAGFGDGILHVAGCESIKAHVPDSLYDFTKIYMVSYPPFTYPTTKPGAQADYVRALSDGCYAGLYLGHGNTHQLADEVLFDGTTDVPKVHNGRRYFFYYYGSCTVGRFDDSDFECIAEEFVRGTEGAIATMGETGPCGALSNINIGQHLFEYLTTTDLTMGECFHLSEVGEYVFIGDPATRPRAVKDYTQIDAVQDSLRPVDSLLIMSERSPYYMKVFVRDSTTIDRIDETTVDRLSGYIFRYVQSGGGFVPFGYRIDGKEVYEGYWDTDTAIMIAPRVSTVNLPVLSVTTFADSTSSELDSIRLYGSAAVSADVEGPQVQFYDGARLLQDDDWVNQDIVLTVKVSDPSGINLLNSVDDTRGFFLYINDDVASKIDLRDNFIYDKNSCTTGRSTAALSFADAVDTIIVNVADNLYNQTTATIVLNTELYGRVSIEDLLIYPNPLQSESGLWFTWILSQSGVVDIQVFTIAGRLIKRIENIYCSAGYNQVYWNTQDDSMDDIANGVYIVKAVVHAENASDDVTETFVIAR
ncbi:MAG: hypothetical protein JSW02_06565 [candidate division WOR-3 bacterium]|nr:MAG: hypothetical protein JSW02_06565 [candidate division WOR-3 bacterium]